MSNFSFINLPESFLQGQQIRSLQKREIKLWDPSAKIKLFIWQKTMLPQIANNYRRRLSEGHGSDSSDPNVERGPPVSGQWSVVSGPSSDVRSSIPVSPDPGLDTVRRAPAPATGGHTQPSRGVSLCTHPGHQPGTPRLMNGSMMVWGKN